MSEECDWNLGELLTEILNYPKVIPRVKKLSGKLHHTFKEQIDNGLNSDELKTLESFSNIVKKEFLARDLYEEYAEFSNMLSCRNYLAAHAFANEIAINKGFVIDKKIDKEFWRMVW